MPGKAGQIVKTLIPSEAVIAKIHSLGDNNISLNSNAVNSNRANSKVISIVDFDCLDVLANEGAFNSKFDADKFALFVEVECINSAYQFDHLFAVNCIIARNGYGSIE